MQKHGTLCIYAFAAGMLFAESCLGQTGNTVLRLLCNGQSTSSSMGQGRQPTTTEAISLSFVINLETGLADVSGFIAMSRLVSLDLSSPYQLLITNDTFRWHGEGKNKTDPITATSVITIDRYSGRLAANDGVFSQIPGKEYIYTREIQAKCEPQKDKRF